MSKFFFKCRYNTDVKKGYVSAKNIAEASLILEKRGYVILELEEQKDAVENIQLSCDFKVLDLKDKIDFFASFARQYRAGIPFYEIFNNIIKNVANNNTRSLCFTILKRMQNGETFEEALKIYSKYIGNTETALLIAGEKSGKLENILNKLLENAKERQKIISTAKSKLTYPAIIFCILLVSFLIFTCVVFPVFDATMAGKTVNIGNLIFLALLKIVGIFLFFGFFVLLLVKKQNSNGQILQWFLGCKIAKDILTNYYFSNFFSVFSMAYSAGLLPDKAIGLSLSIFKDVKTYLKIAKIKDMISQGCEITTAFNVANIFSEFAISQIATGEKTGQLEESLNEIACDYKRKFEEKVNVILKSLEPLMLVFAAILVLFLAYGFFTKYYQTLFSLL